MAEKRRSSFIGAAAAVALGAPEKRGSVVDILELAPRRSTLGRAVPLAELGAGQSNEGESRAGLCAQLMVAQSWGGIFCCVSSLLTLQPLYIYVFGANAVGVGAVDVLVTLYGALNDSFFGRWSDQGVFNVGPFRVETWGRRAPMAALGLPVAAAAMLLTFGLPAGLPRGWAPVAWYAMSRTVLSTGLTMVCLSSTAGVSELWAKRSDRAFVQLLIVGVAVVGALPGIALSSLVISAEGPAPVHMLAGAVTAGVLLLCVPWVCVMRRTPMVAMATKERLVREVRELLAGNASFRWFLLAKHVGAAGGTFSFAFLPFFLRYCMEWSVERTAVANGLIITAMGVAMLLSLPVAARLNNRFHPANLLMIGRGLTLTVVPCWLLAYRLRADFDTALPLLMAGTALGFGSCGLICAIAESLLTAWLIDEDQVARYEAGGPLPARRDGLFAALVVLASLTGEMWRGLGAILLGAIGFDADEPVTPGLRTCILLYVVAVGPGLSLLAIVGMLPSFMRLRGDRLLHVQTQYARLFNQAWAEKEKGAQDL